MRRFFALTLFVIGFLLLRAGTAYAVSNCTAPGGAQATLTTVTATPATTVYGQTLALAATVCPTTDLATCNGAFTSGNADGANNNGSNTTLFGTVQFQQNGMNLGSPVQVSSGGTATLNIPTNTTLNAATNAYTITAAYTSPGTASPTCSTYANSLASQPVSETVGKASTTTTLSSSANPSQVSTVGAPVNTTLTASVAVTSPGTIQGATGLGGSVTYTDNGQALTCGSISISRVGSTDQYTCTTQFLTNGPHNIVATYAGSGNYNGSISSTYVQNATAYGSAVSVNTSPNPSNVNDNVAITATVTTTNNAFVSTTNPGTVTFIDTYNGQATVLTTASLIANPAGTSASATYSTTTLGAGSHSIVASYSGDAQHAASSSAPVTQTVVQAGSVVLTFTSSANPAVVSQNITLTATLSGTNPAGLGGTIAFTDSGNPIGTAQVNGNSGSIQIATLAQGTHSLTATYSGDNSTSGAQGTLSQVVNKANSSVALTSSSNPTSSGSATFTANVTAVSPGSGVATGTITFMDGTKALGTAVNVDNTGTATYTASNLSNGSHSITATYSGDTRFNGSSGTLTQSVSTGGSAVATVTLSASPNPSEQGDAVTITANVAVPTGVPTGSITVSANNSQIGTVALDANGNASFTTTALPLGTTEIEVSFDGAGFYPSGSGTINVVVNAKPATGSSTSSSGSTSSSTSSSGSTTTSSGSTGTAADGGTTTPTNTVTVGSDDSGCSTTSSSNNPLSGIAAFALGMLGLALIRRRRAA